MLGRRHHFPLSSRTYLQIHNRVAGLNIAVPFNFPWDDEHMEDVQGKCGSGVPRAKVSHNSIHRPTASPLLTGTSDPQRACQLVYVMYRPQK